MQQEPTNAQRGTDSAPLVVKLSPAPNEQAKAAEQAAESKRKAGSEWWIVRLTATLASVALIQVLMFWWQLGVMKATVVTMKDTAQRQLRAYISVEFGEMYEQGDPNANPITKPPFGSFWWAPLIVNTGQTPAYDVVVAIGFSSNVIPLPENTDFATPLLPGAPKSKTTLGPGKTLQLGGFWPPRTAETHDQWKKGLSGLYVFGEITYRDAFNAPHRTQFCHCAQWRNGIQRYATEVHNDAD